MSHGARTAPSLVQSARIVQVEHDSAEHALRVRRLMVALAVLAAVVMPMAPLLLR